MKKLKRLEAFKAIDESGKTYEVNLMQYFVESRTFDNTKYLPGMKKYIIYPNETINRIDDNTFLIVSTNTTIKRI